MPDVLDALATLADHPPRPTPPVHDIRDRAATRRRHRRRRRAAGAVLLVAAVAAGTTAVVRHEERAPVATDGRPTTTTSEDPGDALSRTSAGDLVLDHPLGLAVEPASDLPEIATVDLFLLDDPGGQLVALQCTADIVAVPAEQRAEGLGACGELGYLREGRGASDRTPVSFTVTRRLMTSAGLVDCATGPGRCVVAVRPRAGFAPSEDRFAPLQFAAGGPLPVPSLMVRPDGELEDGETTTVVGRGMQPGAEVALRQCLDGGAAPPPRRCDAEARTREVTVGTDGSFTADVTIYRDIGVGDSADGRTVTWTACDPCLLEAFGGGVGSVTTPISVVPTATPIHPTIRIAPEGPYAPGQVVRVEGSGFAPTEAAGTRVDLMFCATTGEVGHCVYPTGDPTVPIVPSVAADGTFVVERLTLPASGTSVFGTDCTALPGACALVWSDAADGAAHGQVVTLDLSG